VEIRVPGNSFSSTQFFCEPKKNLFKKENLGREFKYKTERETVKILTGENEYNGKHP
jgi:hypothetical protein